MRSVAENKSTELMEITEGASTTILLCVGYELKKRNNTIGSTATQTKHVLGIYKHENQHKLKIN